MDKKYQLKTLEKLRFSTLYEKGVNKLALQQLLGHSFFSTTEKYLQKAFSTSIMNNEKELKLRGKGMPRETLNPAKYIERLSEEISKVEKYNSSEWFWKSKKEITKSEGLIKFENTELPAELQAKLAEKIDKLSLFNPQYLENYHWKEREAYRERAKASIIVEKERNRLLDGAAAKGEMMANEIESWEQCAKEKEERINSLENSLVAEKKEKKELTNSAEKTLRELNEQKHSVTVNLEAIANYQAGSLPYRIKMAEIEAYNAKRDFILANRLKENFEVLLKAEETENKHLREKYEGDINDKIRKVERLAKQVKGYEEVIKKCHDQIESLKKDKERIKNTHDNNVIKLNETNSKLAEYNTWNKTIYHGLNEAQITLSNISRIGGFLLILALLQYLAFFKAIRAILKGVYRVISHLFKRDKIPSEFHDH